MLIKEIFQNNCKSLIIYKNTSEHIDINQIRATYNCKNIAVFVLGTQDTEKTLREIINCHSTCILEYSDSEIQCQCGGEILVLTAVGYCRLSKEDGDMSEVSNSIQTQQDIIKEYAAAKGLTISDWFIDDGYSGYTFDRPALNKMKSCIRNIDIIIAKDLSRIGRNNAKVLLLLEEFQESNKQLILVNDNYNSINSDDDITIPVKSLVNELYLKDISKKIKSSISSRQKKGEIIFGVNFYGYIRHPYDKNKLIIDDKTAHVVKHIFELYIQGMGYRKICEVMNSRGYLTPSQRIQELLASKGKIFRNRISEQWQTHMIQRIIQNPIYMGTLITHKKQNKKMKGKQYQVPAKERYYFENNHEAIITPELFDLAQNIKNKKKESNYRGKKKYDYLFFSLCYCGECGHPCCGYNLGRNSPTNFIPGYNCTQYTKYGKTYCYYIAEKEDTLLFFFREFLKQLREKFQSYLEGFESTDSIYKLNGSINNLKKDLYMQEQELNLLFLQKIKDISKENDLEHQAIIEKSYNIIEKDKIKRIMSLNETIQIMQKGSDSVENNKRNTALAVFDSIINSQKPDRKLIELLIKKIVIYKDKTIEFQLNIEF